MQRPFPLGALARCVVVVVGVLAAAGTLRAADDPANGEGRHIGIMAQDLEKTEAGRWLVTERNGVKTIDAKKAIGALLASNAELTKRLDRVEKK